ncbi:transporter [Clostridia bacterium]|nr:transporter [Clostridia bacterium]
MNIIEKVRATTSSRTFNNERQRIIQGGKGWMMSILRLILIVGISYVILGPMIGIVSSSFFSDADKYNPVVYMIPQDPTVMRYELAIKRLDYWAVLLRNLGYVLSLSAIQVVICSLVGYGFARFKFPLKNVLFGCVILTIVIPTYSIMLSMYMTFQNFDPLGIIGFFTGGKERGWNLLTTTTPMYILTVFGAGLRSGLYIYIFNQFFRGLPKEIEEAASVDGAGTFYTYARIMMPNAMPSIITVLLFSMVWQYNDTYYANLFNIKPTVLLSKQIGSLQATISNLDLIKDPAISTLYLYAGIVLVITPLILLYVILQKQFIEGVERSGIVG